MHGGQHFLVLRGGASWKAKAGKGSLSASKLRANEKNLSRSTNKQYHVTERQQRDVYDAALSRDFGVMLSRY